MALRRSWRRPVSRCLRSIGSTPTEPTVVNAPARSSRLTASGSRSYVGLATARPAPCTILNSRPGRNPSEASSSCPSAGSSSGPMPGMSAGAAWSCTTIVRPRHPLLGSGSPRRVSCSAGSFSVVDFVYTLLAGFRSRRMSRRSGHRGVLPRASFERVVWSTRRFAPIQISRKSFSRCAGVE